MAQTIVRRLSGADFSANNVGFLDLEPAIALPANGLEGYFRFRVTEDRAKTNKVAGKANASKATGTGAPSLTVGPKSLTAKEATLIIATLQPPFTVISVVRQIADVLAPGRCLGGCPNTSSTTTGLRIGLIHTDTEIYRAYAKNGSSSAGSAALGSTQDNRDEMIVGVFDSVNNQLKVRRPRTNESATAAYTNWGAVTSPHRLIGDTSTSGNLNGEVEGYLSIVYSRALSDVEIDAIYASAKASLAVSGISI